MIKYLLALLLLVTCYPIQAEELKLNPERTVLLVGPIVPPSLAANTELILLAGGSKEPIDIVINSPGGYVTVGLRIISTIEHVKAQGITVRCFVPEYAASMAFQILLHCSERHALDMSQLLFHRVRVMLGMDAVLTGPDANALARDLLLMDRALFSDIKDHLNMPLKWLKYHFDAETFHIATNLCKQDPEFITCHKSVGGLLPSLIGAAESHDNSVPLDQDSTMIYMTPSVERGVQ